MHTQSASSRPHRSTSTTLFGLGLIPRQGVPEIKIRYHRTRKIFLGKITDSKDAADFIL